MEIKAEVVTKALNVVQDLLDHGFHEAISYYKRNVIWGYELGWMDWLVNHEDWLYAQPFYLSKGCTKSCIYSDDFENWVVKIGFDRSTNLDYISDNLIDDYCDREVRYYQMACARGLGEYFAATYYIGEVYGTSVYLQEKVTPDEDAFSSCFFEYGKKESGYSLEDFDNERVYDELVADWVDDMDSEDRVRAVVEGEDSERLVAFVEDLGINDLHSGNWGKTMDGRSVMFDFSGYDG